MPSLHLPLVVAALAVCASPALAVTARSHLAVPLLTGPAKSYASVGVIPKTARLDVIWCGTSANWCLVEVKSRVGWVPLSALTFYTKKDAIAVVQQADGSGPSGPPPADPGKPVAAPTISGPVNNTLKAPDDGPQQAKPIISDGPAPHQHLDAPPPKNDDDGSHGVHVDAPVTTFPIKTK